MDNRYYFNKKIDNDIYIEEQEAQHLLKVRRCQLNDNIVAFCGDGFDYFAKITKIEKNSVVAHIENKTENKSNKEPNIVVYLANLKNDALVNAIDYLTELNVTQCKIFMADRSIAQIEPKKLEKLKAISIQACKQSERAKLMDIQIINKKDILQDVKMIKNVFFAYEDATKSISKFKGDFAVIIGAEGGFSNEEVKYFASFATPISLGATILRAPVACVSAVSALKNIEKL